MFSAAVDLVAQTDRTVGRVGFEPTQHEALGLQPSPTLRRRRRPECSTAQRDFSAPGRAVEHSDIARAARSLSLRYAADDFQYEREFPGLRSTVMPMSTHVAVSPQEAADRLAIRELFDAYAHCADRRWLFSERQLLVDWTETRPSNP